MKVKGQKAKTALNQKGEGKGEEGSCRLNAALTVPGISNGGKGKKSYVFLNTVIFTWAESNSVYNQVGRALVN
ncbi:hypothetical protein T4B_7031 [Trichinella pseudospiralis]|uniref:Uncharacterized protein n=1 Tax=Trichinella pseudospiralis TaxID=6337 RepID=A0A0V1ID93_TRIPS|nr:hypothetical protein T4B_7031 [Trichinella pseudospiralis]